MFRVDQNILVVRNPRADSSHLANLTRDRNQLRTTIGALEGKKQLLLASFDELTMQQERFRIGRIEQLEQRLRQADTDMASAEAQYSVASDALNSAETLRKTDAVSQAFLDKAAGEAHVAEQTVKGQVERRKGMLVELDAAKKGTFVGDSYNDTPQSAQRKMEVSLELSDVQARLVGSQSRTRKRRSGARRREQGRHDELSNSRCSLDRQRAHLGDADCAGRARQRRSGSVQLLDCGSAMVTASVSETAYQRLAVGQTATFRPRDGGEDADGHGRQPERSRCRRIQQRDPAECAHRASPITSLCSSPDLAQHADCHIGRSGLVQFDTASLRPLFPACIERAPV